MTSQHLKMAIENYRAASTALGRFGAYLGLVAVAGSLRGGR